jgi:hypothetical protein
MNCNEFEVLVNDLARKHMMDAGLRDKADSHAKDCARCNARLVEEKQLTVGLRALAILDENKKAPANLEANLLTAFRKNAAVIQSQVSLGASGATAVSHKSRVNYWWVAAAVILIIFAIAALRTQQNHKIDQVPEQIVQQPKPQEVSPDNKDKKNIAPESPAPQRRDFTPVGLVGSPNKKTPALKVSPKDLNKLPSQVAGGAAPGSASTAATESTQESHTQSEMTTPFISLTQGYTLPMPEGGQVLRVEMPRSALASFGLPVNEERMSGRIKADVVVGNDGIPRAIRFVR